MVRGRDGRRLLQAAVRPAMKPKQILKITADVLMTATLLLLMAYSLVYGGDPTVGETVHEWLGVGMFALFVLHHILNRKWSGAVLRGRYTPYRVLQTVLVALVLLSMCGSMISGILLSRTVFSFLGSRSGQMTARTVHMLSAYWGFVFMSLHLGLHWGGIISMARKLTKKPSKFRKWTLRGMAALVAAYGAYAFVKRDFSSYILLQVHFVFFDFNEPLALFLLDYVAIMGLFVCIGYYLTTMLVQKGKRKR